MSHDLKIDVRFHAPPEDLRRYFTTFYHARIDLPDGGWTQDSLQPEWANLRFFDNNGPQSWFDGQPVLRDADFTATGPSSKPCHFRMQRCRFWGIGLLPLGWSRFVRQPASQMSNKACAGRQHPAFAPFIPLADRLFGSTQDEAAEFGRIVDFFRQFDARPADDDARILAVHAALIDPQVDSVTMMVERAGLGHRTLERLCHQHFGFPPKLLLRRQRFMRSLAQFMLDPTLKWIGAIDSQYHDQAQFVRDFHEFMGMAPREYAAMPHPVLERFMQERARMLGAAVQTMDSPQGSTADHA